MADGIVIRLENPDLWQTVGNLLAKAHASGRHCTYDLSDESHAIDVVQIVCEAIGEVARRG